MRRSRLLGAQTLGQAVLALGLLSGCMGRTETWKEALTNDVLIEQVKQSTVQKIDLLFVIDNSISMADKQAVLRTAVPALLSRLIMPRCLHESGQTTLPGQNGSCPSGSLREFRPVDDMHIGVITSSLGSHGGDICWEGNGASDDRAELLPSVRPGLTSHKNLGFLAWKGTDGGLTELDELIQQFSTHVSAVGETGCGLEATLESWYRFLIDPEPPFDVVLDASGVSHPEGVNQVVLDQRAAFLRPDSLVAIIMLSDENDCSIQDTGQGYLVASSSLPESTGQSFVMPPGTSECEVNPNDTCCRSCALVGDLPGCPPIEQDSACIAGNGSQAHDALNLRCHDQKRRFGIDLLYPTSRYVSGLKDQEVPGRDGALRPNPLYANLAGLPRDPSLVFLAGIVGVPWQDLATDDTRHAVGSLKYLSASELGATDRWDVILGDPTNFAPPLDPFMIEQSAPRSGSNPITGDSIGPPTSTNPESNSINGHEYYAHPPRDGSAPPAYDDLQYACIYPLSEPRDCSAGGVPGCDCDPAFLERNKPLCNPPGGGPATPIQHYAKAYPGLRELEVLKNYAAESDDANSVVTSICPKVLDGDPTNPAYGYNPAVEALLERLRVPLTGRCFAHPLDPDENGLVPCTVVEVSKDADCGLAGRAPVADAVRDAVSARLEAATGCTDDCDGYAMCEILPAGKSANGALDLHVLQACQGGSNPPSDVGYCYLDEAKAIGNASILAECPPTERQLLRFIGDDTPRRNAVTFIACGGEFVD